MAKKYIKNREGVVSAITTENLQLEKPLANENYDIEVHNRNMDKIDVAVQEVKGKIDGLELVASNVKMADGTTVEDSVITNKTNLTTLQTNLSTLQTKVNNGQNHKLSQDNGFSITKSQGDLNTLKQNGFYYVTNGTNAPVSNANWYVEVVCMNGTHIYQKAIRNLSGNSALAKYERTMYGGSWTAWRSL